MTPLVLKIGGSVAESGRLQKILAIVRRARRPVVVVPGGGPFADAVREMQDALGFSDEAAHDMALQALHQMSDVFCALEPRLVPEETLLGIAAAWRRQRIPVWRPAAMCAGDRAIPRDWTVTSDGLAARLAERLGNVEVMLVKSCRVRAAASAGMLARQGIVDPVFPEIVARAGLRWRVIGGGDLDALKPALDLARRQPMIRHERRPRLSRAGHDHR